MGNYSLRLLGPEDEEAFLRFEADWGEEKKVPYAFGRRGRTYEQWLRDSRALQETKPEGWVCSHTYFLCDEQGAIAGAVDIRHELNEHLLQDGGHIGYGIAPSYRGRGLGLLQCRLALEKARELGIRRALITCDDGNTPSARTIEACGGVLEDKRRDENGILVRRYWIDLA